ncbi:septum formation initiator family protein [Tissierella creatinini]|nr:septum formation initiator family protein [Tissierella creatinini]TJX63714.1 septum formation initiator family protein [Soehngenia saccharolytica]
MGISTSRKKVNVRKKKSRGFRLIHLVLIFLGLYLIVVLNNQRGLMKDLEAKKKMNQEQINGLKKEIKELNKEIEASGTLEFVEKVAREELGMVKPREIIYVDRNKSNVEIFDVFKDDN